MPDLVKRVSMPPSLSSQTPAPENQVDGIAGEDIDFADLCYIGADGRFYRAHTGTPEATQAIGLAATKQREDKPVTIYLSAVFGYTEETGPTAAVPGRNYFVSATPGRLSDTAPDAGAGVRTERVAFGRVDGNVHITCG